MYRRLVHRLFPIVAALAVVVFATIAVAHGHLPGKSPDDAHCTMCMAVHSGHHVLASSVVGLQFTPVQWDLLVLNAQTTVSSRQFPPTQGRAPPLV